MEALKVMDDITSVEDVETIDEQKERIVRWVHKTNDRTVLHLIAEIEGQYALPTCRISAAELSAIDRGIEADEKGLVVPHEVVRKRYERWLSK